MTTLDELFHRPTDIFSLSDPRLRNWKARLDLIGTTATLEVFRPDVVLGLSQPEMNIQFTENGKLLPLETVFWDDDLNAGLIQLRVRATDPDQEATRFALGLRAAMRKANREFGDGYFNTVLADFLKRSDLIGHKAVADILKYISTGRLSYEGGGLDSFNLCREMIADAISGRARELTGPLGYFEEAAKRILVDALARYLDERFSVSRRRQLGLL